MPKKRGPYLKKEVIDGNFLCRKCREWKPYPDEFYICRSSSGTDGFCRHCHKKDQIKRNYGLSWDGYKELFTVQNGECAICSKHIKGIDGPLTPNHPDRAIIDHCHDSGKIRGLLCSRCNAGIGFLNDSLILLESAAEYLRRNN